jgi:DUF4097 and DUF4098 domain-containing protein YvlB
MTRSTARLLLIITASLGTSVALAAHRTYDNRLNAPPGGQLTFDADVGSVTVVGRDAHEVVVHADLQASESFLSDFHISAEQTPSGVTISARRSHKDWFGWFNFNLGSTRVQFTVEVPRDYRVHLQTAGGNLEVRDLNASVRGATSGGGVLVQNVTGTVDLHSSGGSIDAQHLNGPSNLSTSGGGIDVADSTGDLNLRTSGGSIHIRDDDGRVDAHTSGGNVSAELRANHGISLSTSGGNITVRLPQDTHATIDAETSGGRVSSDFPLSTTQSTDSAHLQGAIGGGGAQIELHTSGGNIRLETR